MMVADKFPNGLIGPIGLVGLNPIFPINSTSISEIKFVVIRVADVALT